MNFKTLDDIALAGLKVLIRADLDVPIKSGAVQDKIRLKRFVPTLQRLSAAKAKTIIIGHLGRPKSRDESFSQRPTATVLAVEMGHEIKFVDDCVGEKVRAAVDAMQPGDILMLENLRFHADETATDKRFAHEGKNSCDIGTSTFAKDLASLADIYVNDAFANSHRAHASMVELPCLLPSYAGPIVQAEVEALERALENPTRPMMAIVGGSKVSTKLDLLNNIVPRVNKLVLGGAMANTFLAAKGINVGASMHEAEMIDQARTIMKTAIDHGCEIILPQDAILADRVASDARIRMAPITDVRPDEMILDVGPTSIAYLYQTLEHMKTLLWNGPLGVFEILPFDAGTMAVAKFAATKTQAGQLVTIAGGGDTAAAMNIAGVADRLTYLSTAGGAFLEWLEGKILPGIAALTPSGATTGSEKLKIVSRS